MFYFHYCLSISLLKCASSYFNWRVREGVGSVFIGCVLMESIGCLSVSGGG